MKRTRHTVIKATKRCSAKGMQVFSNERCGTRPTSKQDVLLDELEDLICSQSFGLKYFPIPLLHFLQRLKMRAGHVARLDRDRLLRLRTALLASHAHLCCFQAPPANHPAALLIRLCAVTESEDRQRVQFSLFVC